MNDVDVLRLLITHEMALKHFYQALARTLTGREAFWLALAGDEQVHADKLRALGADPAINPWLLGHLAVNPEAVASSISHVQEQIERAEESGLTAVQALSIARDFETALVDGQFSTLDPASCTGDRSVLLELLAESKRHRAVVVAALEAEKTWI